MLQFLFYLLCSCSVFVLFLFVLFSYFVSIFIVFSVFVLFPISVTFHILYIYIYLNIHTCAYTYVCRVLYISIFNSIIVIFLAKNTYDNVIDRSDPTLLSKFDAVPYKSCFSVCVMRTFNLNITSFITNINSIYLLHFVLLHRNRFSSNLNHSQFQFQFNSAKRTSRQAHLIVD